MARPPKWSHWTDDEIRIFNALYPKAPIGEVLAALPGRTLESLRSRSYDYGPKRLRNGSGICAEDTLANHFTEAERGYLAGIFDGEGTISMTIQKRLKPHWRPHCCIVTTIGTSDGLLLEWLRRKIPAGSVHFRRTIEGHRALGCWSLSTRGSIAFLRELLPLLIVKRSQAEVLLGAWARWNTLTDEERRQVKADLLKARIECPQALKHQDP